MNDNKSICDGSEMEFKEYEDNVNLSISNLRGLKVNRWQAVAEELCQQKRSGYHGSNMIALRKIIEENVEMFSPILEQCPGIASILCYILDNKLTFVAKEVDWTSKVTEWGDEECKRVGHSFATFMLGSATGEHAVDAWRSHYVQLNILFEEVEGFEEFMVVIANNLMRGSIYGAVSRVSVGAVLSITDAATDIYVIATYYEDEELYGQANAFLAMLALNIFLQLVTVWALYKKKSWSVIGKEVLITILFLRPAVDAYRVSTNHGDEEAHMDPLAEMVVNKGCELGCESIPGCILQLYVWLLAPEKAGTFALVSIGISCLTTGFTSAMIAFDYDIDVPHRMSQPKFYGYIPNENGLRGRCFVLMTWMCALHSLSRSLGCALLAASDTDNLVFIFVGVEIGAFILFKILRRDLHYWPRLPGVVGPVVLSILQRIVVKIIVDFSGCLHHRHPYELGGLGFTLSIVWAQILPFVALQFSDSGMKGEIKVLLVVSFMLWLSLTIVFFCTIDLSYLNTFFGTKTAPQYTCELFMTSKDDHQKFRAVFKNRTEYTKSIHEEVKEWVAINLSKWRREEPDWFNIERIPDELLPNDVFEAVGGAKRRRSSVSLREIVGLQEIDENERRVHPHPEGGVRLVG